MLMVRTMKENQDPKKTVSDMLDVEKNPKKAFILWFSSEAMAILDYRWQDFKHQAIVLLQEYEQDDLQPTQMLPSQMVPPQQLGGQQQLGPPQQLGHPQQLGPPQQQGPPQQ